jgi:hypothetical protein
VSFSIVLRSVLERYRQHAPQRAARVVPWDLGNPVQIEAKAARQRVHP